MTSRSKPGLATHDVVDGIQVYRTRLPARNALGWFGQAAGSTGRTRALAAAADIAHAQAFPSLLPCALALAGSRTPPGCTLHASHFLWLAANRAVAPALGKLVELSDHDFEASKETADVGEGLGPSISVDQLVNGFDTGVFALVEGSLPRREGRCRLIVARRPLPKNGVEYFVRAMPMIRDGTDVVAVVIGDGLERGRLEVLAAELGVADRIEFLGAQPHPEMPGLICSGELAVFPWLVEVTSVAALECMSRPGCKGTGAACGWGSECTGCHRAGDGGGELEQRAVDGPARGGLRKTAEIIVMCTLHYVMLSLHYRLIRAWHAGAGCT